MVDLNEIQKKIYQNKVNKKFNLTNIYQEFCYIYGEVAEAYDAWYKKQGTEAISLELADVAIYTLGLAEMLGISLEDAILKKMAINEKRVYVDGKKVNSDIIPESK
ncbi:MAG: hypothetical protein MJ054_01565 [Clostridia bacterium]|nr:hypothetical protein [Clostridia bacterium]